VINKDKSAIMFSPNTGEGVRGRVMHTLNIQRTTMNDKYLGMPVHVGQCRAKVFAYLKERVWRRIQSWKEKALSWAGKEVLIKAVAQAIPTFVMGCFDLTKDVCDQISTVIARYWWSNQDEDNKIHWISWEKLIKPKEEGGLGFRDIHTFNMAMLAKQGWRLIHNPDSLCAQVLRDKYFPQGDILKASQKPNMSYTWRSISKGIDVLKAGIVWRVGNGSKINIWSDPWLPRDSTRRPFTPRGSTIISTATDLINSITGGWDEELVSQIFWPKVAQIILSLPVHPELEDIVAWYYKRGLFSVKSAYKVYRRHIITQGKGRGASTVDGGRLNKKQWKQIWHMKCPAKVKQFLWRFTHNSLAVKRNLERRGVEVDIRCVMCNRHIEDSGHLFLNCKQVKALWRELFLEQQRCLLTEKHSASEVMAQTLLMDEEVQTKVVLLFWLWWQERNAVREGEHRRTMSDLAYVVHKISVEYLELHKASDRVPTKQVQQWCKPPSGWLKVNADGAFSAGTGDGGWGYVIRDEAGVLIFTGAGRIHHFRDALHAEVVACTQGVKAAAEKGISKIILETDSLILKQALANDSYKLAEVGRLIFEVKNMIVGGFSSFVCKHVPRNCNKVAHALAAHGSLLPDGDGSRWESPPDFVSDFVASDAAVPIS
jgi:hypothetical protein